MTRHSQLELRHWVRDSEDKNQTHAPIHEDPLSLGVWTLKMVVLDNYYWMWLQDLQSALRRAGQNPTESEVQDMKNKIDDGSASLSFPNFCLLIGEKTKEMDHETHFKDTFRVFSKDEEGGWKA